MGFKRHPARATFAIALLLGGAGAGIAQPARSAWTPLPDPNAGFVPAEQQSPSDLHALDRSIADFSVEVARAIAVRQQENDAACRAAAADHGTYKRSAAWHASCRYRRY
jgi:hypothetical protein